MSEQGQVTNAVPTPTTQTAVGATAGNQSAAKSAADELVERFSKRGKIAVDWNAGEEAQGEFVAAVTTIRDEAPDCFIDWTEKAPESFKTLALIKQENTGNNVLIAIPDRDTMFSDPSVSAYLYRIGKNKIMGAADSEDATEARFITPSGCFTQRFDRDAYKFQAKGLVKTLHNYGVTGITVGSLEQAFASQAFAKSQFPRVPEAFWEKFIGLATAYAEKKGYDTSLFTHWIATRNVQADTGAELSIEDLLKIDEADIDDARNVQTTDAETAAATQHTQPQATGATA